MKIAVEKRYCGQKHVSKFHQHPSFTCNVSHPNAIINESKDLNGPSTFHGKKYFGSLFFHFLSDHSTFTTTRNRTNQKIIGPGK